MPIEDLKSLISEAVKEQLQLFKPTTQIQSNPEFCCERIARVILSGDPEKPISKPLFNELRAKGAFHDYPISSNDNGKRKAFKYAEIIAYLESQKQTSKVANPSKAKAPN